MPATERVVQTLYVRNGADRFYGSSMSSTAVPFKTAAAVARLLASRVQGSMALLPTKRATLVA